MRARVRVHSLTPAAVALGRSRAEITRESEGGEPKGGEPKGGGPRAANRGRRTEGLPRATPSEPAVARRFEGTAGIAIPDNDPTGVTATASVTGVTTGAVAIEVDIEHTYRGDLVVTVGHGGRTWTLHERDGGSADDLRATFPLDALGDAFTGDPSGAWTLHVSDRARVDTGTLRAWAVVVMP